MVRFSDIIRTKGKKKEEKKPPEAIRQEEGFRLSDSQFFKARDMDAPPPKKAPARKASTFEISSYYMAFIDKAQETSQWVKNDMQISPSPVLSDLHAV
ncbi:MAG: hypothetical protein PVG39_30750, partial [Desulfobacteraceae bacterium]